GDVLNWLEAGGTGGELTLLAEATPDWKQEQPHPDDHDDEPRAKTTQTKLKPTQILLGIAPNTKIFQTPDHVGDADPNIGGHREAWPVRSRTFRRWLAQEFYKSTGSAPNSEARASALNIVEAQATFSAPERKVSVRIASHAEKLYVDLADEGWRAVE